VLAGVRQCCFLIGGSEFEYVYELLGKLKCEVRAVEATHWLQARRERDLLEPNNN
jgi:hypothetical protein